MRNARAPSYALRITSYALRFAPFQNRHRRRIIVRVTQAELKPCATALLEKFRSVVVQDDEGLARFLAAHFHVLPSQLLSNSGAERFGDRLFRRKTRGEERRGISMGETIGDLDRAQDAIQKTLAKFFVGSADAG